MKNLPGSKAETLLENMDSDAEILKADSNLPGSNAIVLVNMDSDAEIIKTDTFGEEVTFVDMSPVRKPVNLDSFAAADIEKVGFSETCITLLRTKPIARLQLLCLLFCFVAFVYYTIIEFLEAKLNEESNWKPARKMYTTSYNLGASQQYEMPDFILNFYVNMGNISGDEVNITSTINRLMESQDYFNDSAKILYFEFDTSLRGLNVESDWFYSKTVESSSQFGF